MVEGLTLESSALKTLKGDKFTLQLDYCDGNWRETSQY